MGHNIVNVNVINVQWENAFASNAITQVNDGALERLDSRLTDIFATASLNIRTDSQTSLHAGGCVFPPAPDDCSHPEGSLRTEGGKIITPGGYTIEATKQHEWIITGPDGKTTRIWGDPHVAEGDGGKWDFKRNSTFVLADGTRINVSTAPWKDGSMTVTSGLEVISGNERVTVSGIDQGKGVVGQVTQDGYAHSNCFGGNDVFVMGQETDDWSYQGQEIVGSRNGGESFELGKELAAGNTRPTNTNTDWSNTQQWINDFLSLLTGDSWNEPRTNQFASNPFYRDPFGGPYNPGFQANFLRESFQLVSRMMDLMEQLFGMGGQFNAQRSRSIYA